MPDARAHRVSLGGLLGIQRHTFATKARYTPRDGIAQFWKDQRIVMDVLEFLIRAALMMGFIAIAIAVLAGLFMVVFGIATGIDKRIQE